MVSFTEYRKSLASLPKTRQKRLLVLATAYKEYAQDSSMSYVYVSSYGDITCRYCKKPVPRAEADVVGAYWHGDAQFLCHADCREAGFAAESYECQKIDADCNDCHFFHATVEGKTVRYGRCERWDIETHALPNFCSALPCFAHRRDFMPD